MRFMLTVLNKMALSKMGLMIANARPDLNESLSNERLTMACLSCLLAYIQDKTEVKAAMLDSFSFALNAPDEVHEAMRPMIYEIAYSLLPETHHEELYAEFLAITFTSLGMADDAMPHELILQMAIGGVTEG